MEFKLGLTLMGLALALGGLAWAILRQRDQVKEKSAELMHAIINLSGQYLALVDKVEAVIQEEASHLTDPTDIKTVEFIRDQLEIWRKLASFNHGPTGLEVFLLAIKMGRVDNLLLAHQLALCSVGRIRELLATPNVTHIQWAMTVPSHRGFTGGN